MEDIERRIELCRAKIREAGREGNAVLARAYAEELLVLLNSRSSVSTAREEAERGLA